MNEIRNRMDMKGVTIKKLSIKLSISEPSVYRKLQHPEQFQELEIEKLKRMKLL